VSIKTNQFIWARYYKLLVGEPTKAGYSATAEQKALIASAMEAHHVGVWDKNPVVIGQKGENHGKA
jgi:hypothetical protein